MTRIDRISEIIKELRTLQFGGPIDDLDAHRAYGLQCRHLLIQLRGLASRLLPDPLEERLNSLEVDINDVFSAMEIQSELLALLPDIETAMSHVEGSTMSVATANDIIHPSVIGKLQDAPTSKFDTTVLVQLCKEINSCYSNNNIVATALTMRAVLNYVPPVFGQKEFQHVVAHSERSLKANFTHLQEGLRKIADFHAHRTIANTDIYPSTYQVESFRPQFELLLHQVLARLT